MNKSGLNWNAQCHAKYPPGMISLAECGFADCAMFYPFFECSYNSNILTGTFVQFKYPCPFDLPSSTPHYPPGLRSLVGNDF